MRSVLFLCLGLFSFLLTGCTIPYFSDTPDTNKEINLLIDQGSRDNAQKLLDTRLVNNPNDMRLLHTQFTLFRKQKKWDDATRIRNSLSPKKQKNTEYEYVIALMRSGKPDNALSIIEQNLSENLQGARWYELQGQALYLQEKYPESIIAFDKALSLDPLLENATINKALALADNGKLNESLLLLDAALQKNPDNALLRYNKGTVLSNLGYQQRLGLGIGSYSYYADALRHFEKAYALDQSDINTIIWLGITYLDLGEYEKAHTVFSVALSNDEHLYDARYYQGKTFLAEGKLQDAKKSFTKLLALNPEYELARSELMSIEEQEKLLEQE